MMTWSDEEVARLKAELAEVPKAFQESATVHEREELLQRYIRRIDAEAGKIFIHYIGPESQSS
ncbi:MAG: hypothetical protein OWU33_12035 [Firmicutes bacterium]|nr:hypothetical protein [Bacillota bacterium]